MPPKDRTPKPEDFSPEALERSMRRGVSSYGGRLGRWWTGKADDPAHLAAYRKIANWLRKRLDPPPAGILDYACGAGHLLAEFRRAFPAAHLVGYDGAPRQLGRAARRLSGDPALALEERFLPDLADRPPPVDLTVFCFPHLLPPGDPAPVLLYAARHPREAKAANRLARALRRAAICDPDETPESQVANIILERMASRHLRRLTAPGGHCARVGYSQAPLEDIEDAYVDYLRFVEGWCAKVRGIKVKRFFRSVRERFVVSPVISDVADHTGKPEDDEGGYSLHLLARA